MSGKECFFDDIFYMALAIEEAWKYQLLAYPNPSVGAVVLDRDGKIVSIEAHKKAGELHGEALAIESAYIRLSGDDKILFLESASLKYEYILKNHNNLFRDFTIYSTLEPCSHSGKTPSCAKLILELGFKRVVFGERDLNPCAKGGEEILRCGGVEVESEVLESECRVLHEPFRRWSDKNFVLFKWAQNLNGSVDGGYISSKHSLEYLHKIRDKVDLLVIGGESVRCDKPTLDARFYSKNAPDILIYSKREDFDREIPLFSVPNREVFISDSLDIVKRYNFVLIEGVGALRDLSSKIVDWNLSFVAPNIRDGKYFVSNGDVEFLSVKKRESDIVIWSRNIK